MFSCRIGCGDSFTGSEKEEKQKITLETGTANSIEEAAPVSLFFILFASLFPVSLNFYY